MKADFNVFKMLTIRAGLEQKIGPGIFLVQAAHQHFELYIYIFKKNMYRPDSASAHWENARYARLPVQPCLRCETAVSGVVSVSSACFVATHISE